MKKKVKRKYRVKQSVKDGLMILCLCSIVLFAMFYQAEKVEEEKRQIEKEKEIVLYVNEK